MTRWHINWYHYVQKAPGKYPTNRKQESCFLSFVDNSTYNSSSNFNKICVRLSQRRPFKYFFLVSIQWAFFHYHSLSFTRGRLGGSLDFCVREKKIMFSRTQKIGKLNITTQIKQLWTLALDLAKRGFKEISNFFYKDMEFVLTRNHFCNWCWSSNCWDFFNGKKSSSLKRSFWNSFGSFIS